jgi:multidrug resistance efflux pump
MAQAQGQLARDEALLNGAELDLVRYKTLLATNAISKQQCDAQDALFLASRAIQHEKSPAGEAGHGPRAWFTVALSIA